MRFVLLLVSLLPATLVSNSALGAPIPLDLPVHAVGRSAPGSAEYAADVIEIHLAPQAAADARRVAYRAPRAARLEVPGLDRVAQELGGVWFEPEFRGEPPPVAGSNETDFTSFYIAHLPPGLELEKALIRLRSAPGVLRAEPIALLPTEAVPNDSLWANAYWFYQPSRMDIHAPEAWDVTTGDTSIVVAVLDTGVLPYHPDLGGTTAGAAGQMWTNWVEASGVPGVDDDGNGFVDDVHGWDFVALSSADDAGAGEDWQDADNDPNDFCSHGTAVAGLVGAITNNAIGVAGTAWKVRVMPVRMGWQTPSSTPGAPGPQGNGTVRMDFAAAAIRYATRMGAQVINCSWANLDQSGLGAAITAARAAGVTVVVAAGNNNQPNDLNVRRDVIAVAASSSNDVIAGTSNVGPDIEIAAPGVGLASTYLQPWSGADSISMRQPSYITNFTGTSGAAPIVSGTVALLQARQRQLGKRLLNPYAALLRVTETADDISAQNPALVGQYGSGRLNAYRALSETTGSTALAVVGNVASPVVVDDPAGHRIAFVAEQRLCVLDATSLDTVAVIVLPAQATTNVAAARLDVAHGYGIFVGTSDGEVVGLSPNGDALEGWPQAIASGAYPTSVAMADLDGDGTSDIVAAAQDGSLSAWRFDGAMASGFPRQYGGILEPVALGDLDRAPGAEVVVVTMSGTVDVLHGDGTELPGWPVAIGSGPTSPSITRVGGNPVIVVAAGTKLHLFTPDGLERSGFPLTLPSAAIADLDLPIGNIDGDPDDEAVVSTGNFEICELASPSHRTLAWPDAGSSGLAPVLGSLTGDATADLLAYHDSQLWISPNPLDTLVRFGKPFDVGRWPTLADIDFDGKTEVLAGAGPEPAFFVFDGASGSAGPGNLPWPTSRANAARTGSRPSGPLSPQPLDLSLSIQGNPSRLPVHVHWSLPSVVADAIESATSTVDTGPSIRIYDVQGRQRFSFQPHGVEGVLNWDGRDSQGNLARPGLYFVRLTDGNRSKQARVVLIAN